MQPVNTSSIFHWNKVDIVNSNGTIASVNSPNEAKSIDINVQETNQYGCLGEIATKQIEVQNCLKIPNIFTPNGDGINEYFEIGAINHYPEAKLQIFNRWGGLVFESNDHEWDGRNSTDGVYYYNLELGECKSFKSWVQVARSF